MIYYLKDNDPPTPWFHMEYLRLGWFVFVFDELLVKIIQMIQYFDIVF